jgi:NAD+-dependent protein deacetylase sirtuin 5
MTLLRLRQTFIPKHRRAVLFPRILTPLRSFASMPSITPSTEPIVPDADLESFQEHLQKSTRILALLGAGLSASSGLPTFRGAGGLWRTHEAVDLATTQAFDRDPGLVWQFYNYRRHMALKAKPNRAHYALAELARRHRGFITLSQNVDGMQHRLHDSP